jgi:hypothetical protein
MCETGPKNVGIEYSAQFYSIEGSHEEVQVYVQRI